MRPAGHLLLLLLASPAEIIAAEPAAATPARLSTRLSEEIRASLPKFVPAEAPPAVAIEASNDTTLDTPSDTDVLVLPKMLIREKRPPGNDPDLWLRDKVIQRKAMAAYRDSMTDLEWALNCWFVPLFSAPPSARARMAYESSKFAAEINRLNSLINVIGLSDPKEAAKLRRAMDPTKLPKEN